MTLVQGVFITKVKMFTNISSRAKSGNGGPLATDRADLGVFGDFPNAAAYYVQCLTLEPK
jgi:hypothetical protein